MSRALVLILAALLAGCADGDAPPPFDQSAAVTDAGMDLSATD